MTGRPMLRALNEWPPHQWFEGVSDGAAASRSALLDYFEAHVRDGRSCNLRPPRSGKTLHYPQRQFGLGSLANCPKCPQICSNRFQIQIFPHARASRLDLTANTKLHKATIPICRSGPLAQCQKTRSIPALYRRRSLLSRSALGKPRPLTWRVFGRYRRLGNPSASLARASSDTACLAAQTRLGFCNHATASFASSLCALVSEGRAWPWTSRGRLFAPLRRGLAE